MSATTTDTAAKLGNLADFILPHLMGKPVPSVSGMTAMSRAYDADITVPGFNGTLAGYQKAGVAFALKARRTLIGDEMGLGKTPQATAAIVAAGTLPAVICCPPHLVRNWVNELAKFAPQLNVVVLKGTKPTALPAADVYVIGDSVVKDWKETLIALRPAALVVDESHRMKERTAKRTKAVKEIAKVVDRDGLVILLSGTAMKNSNHIELLSQIEVLGITEAVFGGPFAFLDRFAPKKDRYSRESVNGVELHNIMRDHFFVRRLREDEAVKAQLIAQFGPRPGKAPRIPVVIEMVGKAAADYKAAEADLRQYLRALKSEAQVTNAMRAEKLVKLGVLRHLAGLAKVEGVVEYVNNIVEQGDQVLVFAHHRDVVKAYAEAFGADVIMGGVKADEVEAAKARFQAGDKKVLVLNMEAGGTGHTLTAATHVVFGEFAWTPGDMEQCEDRADRIGQNELVVPHWTIAGNGKATVDERIVAILNDKGDTTGKALDGKGKELIDSDSVQSALLASYEDEEG